jgi:hypothetical protein
VTVGKQEDSKHFSIIVLVWDINRLRLEIYLVPV